MPGEVSRDDATDHEWPGDETWLCDGCEEPKPTDECWPCDTDDGRITLCPACRRQRDAELITLEGGANGGDS